MFVHTIVISAMHQKDVSLDKQREELKEKVVKVTAIIIITMAHLRMNALMSVILIDYNTC